jgi:hypothetical protein
MLVGAHDGAIDVMDRPIDLAGRIGLRRDGVEETLLNAGLLPPVEATGHRAPGAITLRQIPPRSIRPEDPQDAVEDGAMVVRWMAGLRFLGWKQRV